MTKKRISEEKLRDVCKLGCGKETCAFLAYNSQDGFSCAKRDSVLYATIREMLEKGTIRAQGDNCDGEIYY